MSKPQFFCKFFEIKAIKRWSVVSSLAFAAVLLLLLLCIYTQRNISIYYRTQSTI